MAYTVVNISSGCLANSLTSINKERVSLNAFRGGNGQIAGVIISAVMMPILLYFGKQSTSSARGYFMAALIFSIISVPCFFICVFTTKEVIGGGAKRKENAVMNLIHSFQQAFSDHNTRYLILAMLCFLTGIFGRLGIMIYYFIYVTHNPMGMAAFGTALSVGMVLCNFYAPLLLNHIDKKWCGVFTCACQAACCTALFVMGELNASSTLIAAVGFLYGFTNIGGLVSFGLGAEIIDDNWIRSGRRSDGVIYSCISFSTKLGSAIGGTIGISQQRSRSLGTDRQCRHKRKRTLCEAQLWCGRLNGSHNTLS